MEPYTRYMTDNKLVTEKENQLLQHKSSQHAASTGSCVNQSTRTTEFALDRSKSMSFDWSDFERVFASEFNSKGGFERLVSFLSEVSKIIAKYLKSERDVHSKVLDFHHPHQLREIMDHCLYVDENPRDLEQLLSDCKETLKYCVKTAHPRFWNQLSTGIDIIGLVAEWVTAAANTNMFTYEMAPVFTLMEETVLDRLRGLIGWNNGDGIFAPGGAISNLYALLAARHVKNPNIKHSGMVGGKQFVVYTSEQSHFSIKKAAIILGIGLDNVVSILADDRGKMKVCELEKAINHTLSNGNVPLMVTATCGTTVLGAFDPVTEISKLCERHDIWLHIDGAWGGSVLFSEKHKHLLRDIHRADSMTWNPHKMMGVQLQCSAIFLKEKGILSAMNQLGADYLFQKDKLYDTNYDTGDKAIQCGRHNDIFKLWLMWRSKGDQGFRDQIDRNFEMAQYLVETLKKRDDYKLVLDQIEGPNVCFWYIPPQIRDIKETKDRYYLLHKTTAQLKSRMMEKGSMMIQYQPLGKLPNFFRVAFSNPVITTKDVDFMIQEITDLATEIEP